MNSQSEAPPTFSSLGPFTQTTDVSSQIKSQEIDSIQIPKELLLSLLIPDQKQREKPWLKKSEPQINGRPKKPMTSFMHFSAIVRGHIKQDKPNSDLSKIDQKIEIAWQNLSNVEKQLYDLLSKQDHVRYQDQLIQFNKEQSLKVKQKLLANSKQIPIQILESLSFSEQNSKSSKLQIAGSHPPKLPCKPYIQFSAQNYSRIRKENPNLKVVEVSKMVGQMWKNLSCAEKEPFQKLYEKEKLRYQKEKQEFNSKGFFTNSKGENSAEVFKPKLTDDVVRPKKPCVPYMYFNKYYNGSRDQQFLKRPGEMWRAMSDQEKKPYFDHAEQDKVRYKKEMNQLMSQGYFVNQNGVKSTDLAVKKNKKVKTK